MSNMQAQAVYHITFVDSNGQATSNFSHQADAIANLARSKAIVITEVILA